jgi:lactate permease
MNTLSFLVALSPILLVLIFLVILRLPAIKAMPLSWLIHVGLAFFIWQIPLIHIFAASLEGIIIAISVLWIIFGAVLLLNVLRFTGAIDSIRHFFTTISPDRRVQVILIAWLFGAFLEGASGFGTPAAICAPLLVALGFPPLASVVLALIANSFPVTYGSIGTTFLIGLAQGLQQGTDLAPIVAEYLGNMPVMEYIQITSVKTTLLNWLPGTLLPLLLSAMLTRFWGENKSWKEGLAIWKFALLAGFTFTTFAFLISVFMGPEFPTLLGSMLALIIMVILAKKGIFLPKEPWVFISASPSQFVHLNEPLKIPTWKALSPYAIATVILLITRMRFLPFFGWLNSIQTGWTTILGTEISTQFAPLYSPGAVFTLTALISVFLLDAGKRELGKALKTSSISLVSSAIALGTAVPLVRIFINSGMNGIGLESMPIELASSMASVLGPIWPLFAPFVGSLGAFISGSATFSNLMFSLFQFGAAVQNDLEPSTINALQTVGAAVGNMICVVNVVAASSVVNLQGSEGRIIRFTLIPSLVICLMVGLIALVLF